ncbi:MAG: hypothetical protein EBY74_07585 [Actinobacteria bacterium]|nr:hypothetical protein [Actinomycetota bacterium]
MHFQRVDECYDIQNIQMRNVENLMLWICERVQLNQQIHQQIHQQINQQLHQQIHQQLHGQTNLNLSQN